MQSLKFTALIAFLAGVWADPPSVQACAVCLTGAEGPTANAYNWSVLFLMAAPYLVGGSIAVFLVFSYRRAAAKKADKIAAEEVPLHLTLNQEESGR